MNITLTDKDLAINLTDSDQIIDVLALSIDQWTENELYEHNIDYVHYSLDYVIEHYDFEKAFITKLNEQPEELLKILTEAGQLPLWVKFTAGNLLAGAFLALELPELFEATLKDWTDEVKDACLSFYDEPEMIPQDLIKELEKAEEDFYKDQRKEWLYGDHRDFAGILVMAEREYGVEDVSVDQAKNELHIELDREQAVEVLINSYNYEDEEIEKMSDKKLEKATREQLIDLINSNAGTTINRKEEQSKKRQEEYAKTKAYQAERKAQAEVERRGKLLQMTK